MSSFFYVLKNNLASIKFYGLLVVCLNSIFFATSLNASLYSWECKKNRSYLIKEREFINEKDRLKNFPTTFLTNLDEKSKFISVTYDSQKEIATINGNEAVITGFPNFNKSSMAIPQKALVLSSENVNSSERMTTVTDESDKLIDSSTTFKSVIENFLLYFRGNKADFVSTELIEIDKVKVRLKNNKPVETSDFEELIQLSKGKCQLLSEEN